MPYRCILLDLDGTILDSTDMIAQSLAVALETHTGKVPTLEQLIAGIGTPLVDQLTYHAREYGIEDPSLVNEMVQTYLADNHARHDDDIRIFDGAKETLDELKARDIELGIVTSKPVSTATRGLDLFELTSHFSVIVGCDTVTEHKPHPAPVLHAMNTLGASAGETVFIGDSTHDIHSGNRAGVATAGVLWGPYPREALAAAEPTFLLEAFKEISNLGV